MCVPHLACVKWFIRGTLLNASLVLAGGLIGLAIGRGLPSEYQFLSQAAIGVGTMAMGIKMFLESANVLVPIGSLIMGVLTGHLIGLQAGMEALGDYAKGILGSSSATFQEGFVTASLLYCVGPMTLLGCFEEGTEGKIRLLALKSMLDGTSSVFLAAALGEGVLLSAGTVLIVQGVLSLGARGLRRFIDRKDVLVEISGAGGLILVAIGLNLLDLRALPSGDFLPALVFAGLFSAIWSARANGRSESR